MSHREGKKAKKLIKNMLKSQKPEAINNGEMKKQKRGGSIELE